jgi:hypothetical protein
VVADEQRGSYAVRQARHHPVGLGLAAQQLSTPVELLGKEVPEARVSLGDENLSIRVAGVHAAYRGVGLSRDQAPVALVFGMARPDVLAVDYAGDTLHVNRHQYPHDTAPFTPLFCYHLQSG